MVVTVVAGIAAVTGVQSKGARQVARTQLMGVGRVVLFVLGLVLVYLAYRAQVGG